jgi:hypothetical protein
VLQKMEHVPSGLLQPAGAYVQPEVVSPAILILTYAHHLLFANIEKSKFLSHPIWKSGPHAAH